MTPWTAACQASLSFTISRSLLKLMSIEPVMSSNHLILCRPLLLLPWIFPSIRVFSNDSALHIRWPKYYCSFSLSISPSNEYSGLISFRTGLISLLSKGLSRICSSITQFTHNSPHHTIQKHHKDQFFGAHQFFRFYGSSSIFNFYFYFLLLYNTVLILPYIDMNPPRVYMRSQTWTPLLPPSP